MTEMPGIQLIPLDQIHESKANPRKTFSEIDELAEDIKQHGLLQPVLVRPQNGHFELVFGARRYRATRKAGLPVIPASVRELDDREALELQVVENAQREDVHPLEEADGYQALHQAHGLPVEEIAAKVGKSKAYVYGRLKLCSLVEAGRKAFVEGELSASIALLIARMPEELQAKATREIVYPPYRDEPLSFRAARSHLERDFMLRLKGAPFLATDADLLPEAGACSACPKRTGNQPELFDDIESADICTDPPCFQKKLDAQWKRRAAEAKKAGQKVLSGKQAKAAFEPYHDSVNRQGNYIDLGAHNYQDPKSRTWRQLIGKQKPEVVLARSPHSGQVYELVHESEAKKALKAAGHDFGRSREPVAGASTTRSAKDRRSDAIERHRQRLLIEAVVTRAETWDFRIEGLREIVRVMIGEVWEERRKAVTARRGLETQKRTGGHTSGGARDALDRYVDETQSKGALRGVLAELAVLCADGYSGPSSLDVAQRLGVDTGKLASQARAEVDRYLKAAAKAKPRKKKAPARKKASGRKKKATRKKGGAR